MGRTLHWKLEGEEQVSEAQADKLFEISQEYNSGEYKDVWTCESFFWDVMGYYPNWDWWEAKGIESREGVWGGINKGYDLLRQQGLTRCQAVNKLVTKRVVNLHQGECKHYYGFCKVGGNAYNALLVLLALIRISKEVFPDKEISLSDEGEFLKCPIIIKNGLAKPDIRRIEDDLVYYEKAIQEGSSWAKEESFLQQVAFFKVLAAEKPDYLFAGMWHRKVKGTDFETHPEYGASQIMAGFNGEYYGLTDKDAELESLKAVSGLVSALEKAGFDKSNIKVGVDIKK